MPRIRNVSVHVIVNETDENGLNKPQILTEWGVRKLKDMPIKSAYIEAHTGKTFSISVRTDIAQIAMEAHRELELEKPCSSRVCDQGKIGDLYDEKRRQPFRLQESSCMPDQNSQQRGFLGHERLSRSKDKDMVMKPENMQAATAKYRSDSTPKHLDPPWFISNRRDGTPKHIDPPWLVSSRSNKPESRRPNKGIEWEPEHVKEYGSFKNTLLGGYPVPRFHLLASLYLDGRTVPERRVLIHLDPDHPDFQFPPGEIVMKTRRVHHKDGKLEDVAWIFKDVGIDVMLKNMLSVNDKNEITPVAKDDEDSTIDTTKSYDMTDNTSKFREQGSKVGQIMVVVARVTISETWEEQDYHINHVHKEMEDADMTDVGKDVTHTAGFARSKLYKPRPVRVVSFEPYRKTEVPFATFSFFYRSKETLGKFRFPGFTTEQPKRRRQPNIANFIHATPLGFGRTTQSDLVPPNIVTFEDKVKGGKAIKSSSPLLKYNTGHRENGKEVKKERLSPNLGRGTKDTRPTSNVSPFVEDPSSREISPPVGKEKNCGSQDRFLSKGSFGSTPRQPATPLSTIMERPNPPSSTNFLGTLAPPIRVSHSSENDEDVGTMSGNKWNMNKLVPHRSSNRALHDHSSDADDEQETSDGDGRNGSDDDLDEKEHDQPSKNEDDMGLSTKVDGLVLGVKRTHSEEQDDGASVSSAQRAENKRHSQGARATDCSVKALEVENIKKKRKLDPDLSRLEDLSSFEFP